VGKVAIGVVAFAAGALVGALVVRSYVQQHGLGLVAQGIVDKFAGVGSSAGKLAAGLGDAVQGIGN